MLFKEIAEYCYSYTSKHTYTASCFAFRMAVFPVPTETSKRLKIPKEYIFFGRRMAKIWQI